MKILFWIIVALVIVGGLFWFMSPNSEDKTSNQNNDQEGSTNKITESTSIESDDEVFNEIDNALSELE